MRRIVVFFSNGSRATFDADKIVFIADNGVDLNVLTDHPDWAIINRNTVCFMRFVKEDNDD